MKSFLQIHKTKIELLTFNSKILLHLSYHKNGIGGSLTFHESKLHVINLNLLPNSVLKNPFYNFHSMFQQFDYTIHTICTSRYQKGKTNLDFAEARDSEWQWHKLGQRL